MLNEDTCVKCSGIAPVTVNAGAKQFKAMREDDICLITDAL